jgi:hypothetical protein
VPAPSTGDVHASLKSAFNRTIPSGQSIARRAVDSVLAGHEHDAPWIKENFSQLVEDIQLRAFEEYVQAEQTSGSAALREVFLRLAGGTASAAAVPELLGDYFPSLDKFFLGLTQGRRVRAGRTFEHLIRDLFERLGYPFTRQPIINGQPDFLMPSEEHFRRHAMDCIIFTAKRTLRERWRQITSEGTRGLGFFLATIDAKVNRDLEDMRHERITLVVPARIKEAVYPAAPNVVSFEYFFQYYVDPAMERWRAAGII